MALFTILRGRAPSPHLEQHIIPSMVWLSFFVHCAPFALRTHIVVCAANDPSGGPAGRGRAGGLHGRLAGTKATPDDLVGVYELP